MGTTQYAEEPKTVEELTQYGYLTTFFDQFCKNFPAKVIDECCIICNERDLQHLSPLFICVRNF